MPRVDTEILKRSFTTTPKEISRNILDLCNEIVPGAAPIWVPVEPAPDALRGECFHNVIKMTDAKGGEILYGWKIWEWPRVFLEAEHHAVWSRGSTLLDITPQPREGAKALFLPDPERIYDFAKNKRIKNIKRSIGQFSSIEEMIAVTDHYSDEIEKHSVGLLSTMDPKDNERLSYEKAQAFLRVIIDLAKATKVNDPCICTSGRKFKKCCRPLIEF